MGVVYCHIPWHRDPVLIASSADIPAVPIRMRMAEGVAQSTPYGKGHKSAPRPRVWVSCRRTLDPVIIRCPHR